MNIKHKTIKVERDENYTVAEYSVDDVVKLITADLKSKGFEPKDVTFKTRYKYVADDWGMNRTLMSEFMGVIVDLKTGDYPHET